MEKGKTIQPKKKKRKQKRKVVPKDQEETKKNWLDFQLDDVLRDSIKHSEMMMKTKKKGKKEKKKGKKVRVKDKSKKSMLTLIQQLDKVLPAEHPDVGTYAKKRKQIIKICQ